MKDYKAIFDAVEATLFKIGSRNVPRDQILAELEPCKHLEGKRLADDEYYRKLVYIAFYSGFRAKRSRISGLSLTPFSGLRACC